MMVCLRWSHRKAVAMRTVTLSALAFFPAGIALAEKREHREHAPAIKLLE